MPTRDGAWSNAPLQKAARVDHRKVIWSPRDDAVRGLDLRTGTTVPPWPSLEQALRTWSAEASPPPPIQVGDATEQTQLEALGYVVP